MKILVAEDDFVSRRILKTILAPYGDCDVVVDGEEAVMAFRLAFEERRPYDLVCLDIMMPKKDGQTALKEIREIEKAGGVPGEMEVKIVMVTALDDPKTVFHSFYKGGATSYIVKPIEKIKIINELNALNLIRGPIAP